MPRKTGDGMTTMELTDAASMRPRPDAAENLRRATTTSAWSPGFNEAAARCRGKQYQAAVAGVDGSGNMKRDPRGHVKRDP